MIFKLRKTAIGGICGHGLTDGPFIDGGGVLLEKRRGNEWLENEPTTKVDTDGFVRSSGERIELMAQ